MPVAATIITYVALRFTDQFIIEEGYDRLKRFFFPKEKYKDRLTKVIYNTIEEFEKTHPYDESSGMFPFYYSQIFFEHLTMFVFFKKGALGEIKDDFNQYPQIIQPTKKELEDFYSLFARNTNGDKVLKTKFIEENYKSQIYEVSRAIDEIKDIVISVKADTAFLVEETLNKKTYDRKNT